MRQNTTATNRCKSSSSSLLLKTMLLLVVAALSCSGCHAFSPSWSSTNPIINHATSVSASTAITTRNQRYPLSLRSFHSPSQLYSSFADKDDNNKNSPNSRYDYSSGDDQLAYLQERLDRTDRINRAAFTNAVVVGSVVVGAFYVLFAEKMQALAALYDYGLGPIDHSGITYAAVSLELLARMPVDAIQTYEALVPTHPVFFKACTSGVAYALGDFLSQLYQGKTLENIDLPRSARSGAAGFIAHGPLCHYWLLFMETYLDFGGAWWATGLKVTADLTVWSIFLNTAYSTIIGLLAFRNPVEVLRDVKATTWPALRSAWRFWPFVHTVSFSHAVPLDLKLLWVDVMEVVWVTILSKVANEDKNKKLDSQQATLNNNNNNNDTPKTPQLSRRPKMDTTGHNVQPDVEMELTRQKGLQSDQPLALQLPQKALAAAWPLLAMWPVLYLGYQVEVALGFVTPPS